MAALLVALAAWGGWLIERSSAVVGGRRIFCLSDDAMISMTYARNLLDGYGLNWARQGAPVEGFTHPLWLLLMLPANLTGIALRLRSLPVQVMSLAALGLAAVAAWRLVRAHFAPPEAPYALPAALPDQVGVGPVAVLHRGQTARPAELHALRPQVPREARDAQAQLGRAEREHDAAEGQQCQCEGAPTLRDVQTNPCRGRRRIARAARPSAQYLTISIRRS
jgi:hypothetical protein